MPYYFDTDPKIEKLQFDLIRQVPISKKLMMVANLNKAAIALSLHSLRKQYPHESEARLHRRLADRILGIELAERAYGPLTEEEETNAG